MNQKIKIFFLFSILSILSCSKEEVNSSNGTVLNGNKEYDLNYVYLSFIDQDLGIYQLHFSNDEITFENGQRIFSENTTMAIDVIIYNERNSAIGISNYYPMSDIEPGHPNYDPPYLAAVTTYFDLKKDGDNWKAEESYFSWNDGSITIVEDNNTYRLDFSLINGDKIITGYFNGDIRIVE